MNIGLGLCGALTAGLYLAYGKKGTLPALLTGATGVGLYALYEHMLSTTHISNPNGQTMAQQAIMGQPGQPGQPGSDGTPGMPGIGGSGGAGGSAVGGIGGAGGAGGVGGSGYYESIRKPDYRPIIGDTSAGYDSM